MDRRRFIRSALIGTGAAAVGGTSLALAEAEGAATTRRFTEQRWTLDNIIRANGIDWDQPRSIYLSAPCGVEANADFAAIRARVQKMADIGPAFESTAKRREAKARDAEAEGNRITARDNWYMAAIHYGAAEWPYDDSGQQHVELHKKKRDCYANYARLADHKIEAVSIPFKGKSIPAWFHLPPGYSGDKVPTIIVVPGMDSFKETSVALANDRWMQRGVAVLAIDGPGQYESPLLGVYVSMQNWVDAGPVLVDWLLQRPGGRRAEDRRHRHELRLVLRHNSRRERAARCRHRRDLDLPRARLPHHLRGGLADLQEALHVDVGLHRREEVRRVRQDAHLGGTRREDPQSLSRGGGRGRRAQPVGAHRADDQDDERSAPARGLCRQPAFRGQRAGGESWPVPAGAGSGLAHRAARRQAVQERALARGADRPDRQDCHLT
jgi:Esterase FrsA-like